MNTQNLLDTLDVFELMEVKGGATTPPTCPVGTSAITCNGASAITCNGASAT